MAAEATRIPRRMAGDAAHVAVLMSALLAADSFVGIGLAAPEKLADFVPAHGFGGVGFWVVIRMIGADRVGRLLHFPFFVRLDHGALDELIADYVGPQLEASAARIVWRTKSKQIR